MQAKLCCTMIRLPGVLSIPCNKESSETSFPSVQTPSGFLFCSNSSVQLPSVWFLLFGLFCSALMEILLSAIHGLLASLQGQSYVHTSAVQTFCSAFGSALVANSKVCVKLSVFRLHRSVSICIPQMQVVMFCYCSCLHLCDHTAAASHECPLMPNQGKCQCSQHPCCTYLLYVFPKLLYAVLAVSGQLCTFWYRLTFSVMESSCGR